MDLSHACNGAGSEIQIMMMPGLRKLAILSACKGTDAS